MLRPAKRSLLAAVVALHGAIALGGPGLHRLADCGDRADRHGGEDHRSGSPGSPDDHCPLCHFFEQGQAPIGADVLDAPASGPGRTPLPPPRRASRSARGTPDARGPPRAFSGR